MLKVLFAIFILLILSSISVSGQDHLPKRDECGIINKDYYYNQKNLTEIGEFPWMGRVQNEANNTYWFLCYGALISKQFMLVNAKCFYLSAKPVAVLFGDWDRGNAIKKSDCDDSGRCSPVPKLFKIAESIIHPNYSSESTKDNIALIKLTEPVKYSEFIAPICLPDKNMAQRNFDNQLLEVTGWFFNKSDTNIKAKTFVRVVNLNTCELRLKNIYEVDREKTICAFTCWDDYVYSAGSALMDTIVEDNEPVNYYLVGLDVFGQGKCVPRNPHAYSRVDKYLDWIYDNTRDEQSSLITPRRAER